ncbi:flagellar motor protein MotB [Polaribacter aestuariivivens]|uniref:Flagellar motor protein MotB n=1 Tax=Polaribacter aestuariivivens TaxID=2304626 RepID=A0A5S3NBQ7_9FLAO|nr:OmpA family protein [Polaribacter aestuariivivens]TMM30336.1 flagellar motor protein MotB [Polaribacter aestuariivivens]
MKKLIILSFLFSYAFICGQNENYSITNLDVNKKFQDFGVAYFGDSTAIFSSAGKTVFMKRVWSGNHEPFLSLFQGTLTTDGQIVNVKPFGGEIDTKYHESNLVFTKDKKTVYFSRNNYNHKKYKTNKNGVNLIQLYKAEINEKGVWTNVVKLPFNSDEFNTGHPALNSDETELYFISDMPGSYGETDIYKVSINADGGYGTPINLGNSINTSKKEMFPFLDENNVLYFSSDGYTNSKGKLDVYVSKLNRKGEFYTPINLGFPINSIADDFAFVKQRGKNTGHFSSNRINGKGNDDIYAFKELKAPYFDCSETIEGVVISSKNNKILPATNVVLYHNNKELASMLTDKEGRYKFSVQCKSNYKIVASKKYFDEKRIEIATENDGVLEVDLALNPEKNDHFIRVKDAVMLNIAPIYFDLGKATIKPVSEKELETVVAIMNKFPEIIIQIRAHTDSRGNDDFNFKLSEKRANATMNWIVNKGIHKDRILAVGFGEEQLVNDCKNGVKCSEKEHANNRRTEFVILNPVVIGH